MVTGSQWWTWDDPLRSIRRPRCPCTWRAPPCSAPAWPRCLRPTWAPWRSPSPAASARPGRTRRSSGPGPHSSCWCSARISAPRRSYSHTLTCHDIIALCPGPPTCRHQSLCTGPVPRPPPRHTPASACPFPAARSPDRHHTSDNCSLISDSRQCYSVTLRQCDCETERQESLFTCCALTHWVSMGWQEAAVSAVSLIHFRPGPHIVCEQSRIMRHMSPLNVLDSHRRHHH